MVFVHSHTKNAGFCSNYFMIALLTAVLSSRHFQVSSFLPNVPNRFHSEHSAIRPKDDNNNIIRPPRQFQLFVASSSSSSSKTNQAGSTRVVYQKVVKAPASPNGQSSPLFLGYLVEYLQDHFTLPDRLPMVYESVFGDEDDPEDDNNDNDSNNNKCIQAWDSPMTSSPEATRLDLEVVAIYTEEDKKHQNNIPSMAMVVVRKAGASANTNTIPSPMMQNLFADSEKRILRALDRGLDDFMAGKIILEGMNDDTQQQSRNNNNANNVQKAQDAMIEEFLEDSAEDHPSVQERDDKERADSQQTQTKTRDIVEADFSKVSSDEPELKKASNGAVQEPVVAQKPSPAPKKESTPVNNIQKTSDLGQEDFAVRAAREASKIADKKRQDKTKSPDFAVAAAQKVAEANKKKKSQNPVKVASTTTPINAAPQEVSPASTPTAADVKDRAFKVTFSTPEAFKKKANGNTTSKKTQIKGTVNQSKNDVKSENEPPSANVESPSLKVSESASVDQKATSNKPKRKLNLKVVDKDGNDVKDPETEKKPSDIKKQGPTVNSTAGQNKSMPSDEEIMETAQQVMDEIAEQGTEMSAEELLDDVMKFGESQEKQNAVGSGFVSGAFEKAKELLQEQKRQRDARLRNKVVDQMKRDIMTSQMDDSSSSDNSPELQYKEMGSEEDDLKRMFEAGERLAEGRITLASGETAASGLQQTPMTEKEEQQIDELIAGDKSVSSYARVLDDELAELEVRINRSPGEEMDGPAKNPLFDVFSGPEVYNPNVDPETAVNWPGAMPGSKAMEAKHLPKELNEAMKQANFAAQVLTKMEVKDGSTDAEKSYFVGERELTQQQVDSLKTVLDEAVEIGIIPDPLVLMSERSRLQMVLDELWEQPEERIREVVTNYKDLLLSDNFVTLIKERLQTMADRDLDALRRSANEEEDDKSLEQAHARERELLGQLVAYAQLLLKEAKALGAELEAQQLEVIRSICKVAMDPSHRTEEETAEALTDAVKDMRPLFDDMFVAYLKYAVAEEEGRLARANVLDDPEHNQWLFVLKIVQQGVYSEIAKGLNRYIEHIWYVLRMETATERRMLLSKLIDVMPTMDVRPFVQVVDNIVGSLGEAAKGEFEADGAYTLGEMTNKLLQLHRDVKELLPPDRIDEMARDADEWAAKQKERLMKQRKLTKQRLQAARDTEHLDDEIESLGKRGEVDRFD